MKVLVAPNFQPDDEGFPNSLAIPGELLIDPGPCSGEEPECGVGFVFLGVASGQPSLEAVVADLTFLDLREFRKMISGSCCKDCARNGNADQMIYLSRLTANRWPVGSVLVRHEGRSLAQSLGTGY